MNTQPTLLTTGQAAQILGCSRQHVVDLCNSGRLPSTTVGTHRRIDRADVDRLRRAQRSTLRREDERSLWLHRALLGHLLRDPEQVMAKARANIDHFRSQHRADGMANVGLDRWSALLDEGVDAVADTLASRGQRAVELRANSPFAGVLPEQERLAIHEAFRRHWAALHEAA